MSGEGALKSLIRFFSMAAAVGNVIVASAVMAFASTYSVTDLGTLPGGTISWASSINNSGQIVGGAGSSFGSIQAVLFSNGSVTDISAPLVTGYSEAYGINNVGQAVGEYSDDMAFIYSNGVATDLYSAGSGKAYAINDVSQAVGVVWIGVSTHAALFGNGTVTDLGTLPGGISSRAYGINASGQSVGYSSSFNGTRAALFSNGTVTDLGTLLGSTSSLAYSINDYGQAVGASSPYTGTQRAVLFSNGAVIDLGSLSGGAASVAYSINNNGQAVGVSYGVDGSGSAVLFSNGTVTDLNSYVDPATGWVLTEAKDINDSGLIVGSGIFNGQTHAFLMTPAPLPAALPLFGSGLAFLVLLRARRR